MLSIRSVGFLLGLPLLAHATKPQHVTLQGYDDLAAGKSPSVSLTEDGVLAAAPATAKLADLGVEEAWSIVAQPDGALLVGTAPDGKLLQVGTDGAVKQLAKFDESHLYAMALGPHGEIYVGTSPDGKVYKVSPDGKTAVYFNPQEKYIWALAVAPDGTLYIGTGTRGKIYRVTAKGDGEVWYASNETHIRCLALDKNGALLAGSADSGYLYRIAGKDQAVVIASTGREEVNQLRVRPDGMIYFTGTGTAKDTGDAVKKATPGGDSSSAASAAPSGGAALYRIDSSLYPETVWTAKDAILSLAWDERDDHALAGTGNDGFTYEITPHGEATRLCRIDSDSVTAMVNSGSDVILASSNPGRLFRLSREKSQPGIYETSVIDSASFARWGMVTLDATEPGSVKILTRSGNTDKPDKTWYPWTTADEGQSQSPPARYFQAQLQIGGGTVDKIDCCYLPKNQAPHIDLVKLLPVGTGYVPAPPSALPPLPHSATQLASNDDLSDPPTPMRWAAVTGHGLRAVVWKASDPNGDALSYTVSWRKRGETEWHDLAKDITDNLLSWDTSGWKDGIYELKIEASDARANASGEGLTDEAISRQMIVNNTPPVIQIVSQKSDSVEFTVTDQLSGLQSVTTSTDGTNYQPLVPVDGILDSGSERFVAKITPGQILFIRAQDGSGNISGAQTGH
jgi:sugar lactone lactonase YvrE